MEEAEPKPFMKIGKEIELPNYAGVKSGALNTRSTDPLQAGDSHTWLSNKGSNSHATIDTAVNNLNDVTANRLLGRVSSSGVFQEISLGANLSFSGSTLVMG